MVINLSHTEKEAKPDEKSHQHRARPGCDRQSLANVKAILAEAGVGMDRVVKTTVFLSDMGNFAAMNGVYAEFFGEGGCPARSAVEVARLPKDALVEIEAIALK